MKLVSTVILGLLTLLGLGYLAYVHFPRVRVATYTVAKMEYDEHPREETQTVDVNGQQVEVKVKAIDRYYRPAYQTKTTEISPGFGIYVKFGIILLVAVVFGIYMIVLVVILARDKWTKRRQSADTRDTQRRLDGIVTFCTGILIGYIGGSGTSNQPYPFLNPPAPASDQLAPMDESSIGDAIDAANAPPAYVPPGPPTE